MDTSELRKFEESICDPCLLCEGGVGYDSKGKMWCHYCGGSGLFKTWWPKFSPYRTVRLDCTPPYLYKREK